MSFDVNIGRSEPVIKAAANMNNDGGSGGNLGYMMGGGDGENQKKKNPFGSIFENDKNEIDMFVMNSKLPKNDYYEEDSLIKKLFKKFTKF